MDEEEDTVREALIQEGEKNWRNLRSAAEDCRTGVQSNYGVNA